SARGDDLGLFPLVERGALRVMVMPRHLQPRQTPHDHEHPNAQGRSYPERAAARVGRPHGRTPRRVSRLTLSGSFHFHGSSLNQATKNWGRTFKPRGNEEREESRKRSTRSHPSCSSLLRGLYQSSPFLFAVSTAAPMTSRADSASSSL